MNENKYYCTFLLRLVSGCEGTVTSQNKDVLARRGAILVPHVTLPLI
jgi:hypothetical protein